MELIFYLFICVLMMYPFSIYVLASRRNLDFDKYCGWLMCLILGIFMSLRGRFIGVDTKYYCYTFTQFRDIRWKDVFNAILYAEPSRSKTFTFDFEPGYRIFNKVLSIFSADPQVITVATSILLLVLLMLVIKQESPYYMLSIWLYMTLGIYQTEMNVSRNAIAIMICYLAMKYIEEGKLINYCVCVIIASTFHQTALFFIPLYFLIRFFHLDMKKMLVFVLGFGFLGINVQRFAYLFARFLPYRYARYLWNGTDNILSVLVGVFGGALFLWIWFFMEYEERKNTIENHQTGYWLFALNLCFFGINLGIEAGARAAALFGPYLICFIPQMLSEIKNDNRRRFLIISIALISFLQYVARLQINNIGGTMPYEFFWNQL